MGARHGAGWVLAVGLALGLAIGPAKKSAAADLAKRIEVSPFAGIFSFDEELHREKGAVFGSRFGYWLTNSWETELSIEGLSSDRTDAPADGSLVQAHADLLYHFDFSPRVAPYLVAGVGGARYESGKPVDSSDTAALVNYGLGVKFLLNDWVALRADVRQPVTFSQPHFNLMYTVGLSFFFGRPEAVAEGERPLEREAEAPKAGPAPAEGPRQAPPPPPAPAPAATRPELTLRRIHFDFDRYTITGEARDILRSNARYLREHPGVQIQIQGHCDERGTVEYNLALGENRARAAFDYLVDLGIAPQRMSIISYGKERPLDPAHNEAAWTRNRRDEFVEQ